MSTNQAIARRVTPEIVRARTEEVIAITRTPIRTIEQLRDAYEALRGKCNLLTPITDPNDILPLHRVSLAMVVLSTTVDSKGNGPHVYHADAFHDAHEVSLGKVGLLLLMQAAGLSITVPPLKLDDGSDRNYSAYQVGVGGRDLRGIERTIIKDGRLDFRDGSPEIRAWGAKQLASSRAHIDSRAETKALSKCLREWFAMQGKYTVEQASLPFVVPVLVVDPDPNNPVDRAFLLNHGTSRSRQLFGTAGEEPRELRNVTPPTLARGEVTPDDEPARETPPPVKETPDSAPPAETSDFDIPAATSDAERVVCGCECGCQLELETAQAVGSTNALGVARCKACFPGAAFDFPKHKDVRSLNYPKAPHLKTAEDVRHGLEKARAAKAAGRK